MKRDSTSDGLMPIERRFAPLGAERLLAAGQTPKGVLTESTAAGMIAAAGAALLRTDALAVYVIERRSSRDGLRMLSVVGLPSEELHAVNWVSAGERSPVADAFRSGQTIIVEDRTVMRVRYPERADAMLGASAETMVCIPLRDDGTVVGVLALAYNEPRDLVPSDLSDANNLAQQCALAIAPTRLLDREQLRRRSAETLQKATAALGSANTRAEVALVAAAEMKSAIRADRATAFCFDINSGVLYHAAPDPARLRVMNRDSAQYARVLRALQEESPVINDAFVIMPCVNHRVGSMAVVLEFGPGRTLADHEHRLLERIALHAGRAYARALRWEAEDFARFRAERLLALSTVFASASTRREAVDATVTAGVNVLGATSGALYLLDAAVPQLICAASHQISFDIIERFAVVPLNAHIPSAVACRLGEEVLLESPDSMAAQYPEVAPVWADMDTRALLVLPLQASNRVLGSLGYGFDRPRQFSDEDLSFARTLARLASVALERLRLLQEARDAAAKAEDTARRKGDFLAMLSHELRTPLQAIAGHVQLVSLGEYGTVTEAQQHALARVQHAGKHMAAIVNDVLRYATIEAGKVGYERAVVSVPRVASAAIELLEPQALAKEIQFSIDADDMVVWADPHKLEQVLVNLLSNAIKFTPHGGRVTIRAQRDDRAIGGAPRMVRIAIIDTGVGIAPDRLRDIFDPFVQVGTEPAMRHGGTGLGLTISREFSRGMGGDLTVSSSPGKGSSFEITLQDAGLLDATVD